MKKLLLFGLLIVALVPITNCSRDVPLAPEEETGQTVLDHEATALALAAEFGWALDPEEAANLPQSGDRSCIPISHINRELVTDGIAHYSFQLRVGPGEFDKIGIHRVVRERRPYKPIRTRKAAFLRVVVEEAFPGGAVLERQVQRPADLEGVVPFRVIVARALGNWERILPRLATTLEPGGSLLVWAGQQMEAVARRKAWSRYRLVERKPLPGRERSWVWRFDSQ